MGGREGARGVVPRLPPRLPLATYWNGSVMVMVWFLVLVTSIYSIVHTLVL